MGYIRQEALPRLKEYKYSGEFEIITSPKLQN